MTATPRSGFTRHARHAMKMKGESKTANGNSNTQIKKSGPHRRKVRLSWSRRLTTATKRNHCKASISRMASSALISPRCNRSRISDFEGVGFVSTNSRLLAIRVSRDLIVG